MKGWQYNILIYNINNISLVKVLITIISFVFRIIARIDDDMLKYYCNEDLFLLDIKQVEGDDVFEVTLIELMDH